MHFEENQLSPCSIGISPLPTAHPSILQHTPVRSSTRSYPSFNLAMGRSHGFGSNPANCEASFRLPLRPIQTRFRCAYASERLKLTLTRLTRGLILQKARSHPINRTPTACRRHGFRFYFTPLPGFFSPFPHGTSSLSVARSI